MVNDVVVTVLTHLLRLAILTLVGYAVTWLRQHVSAARLRLAKEVAAIAVRTAEQLAVRLSIHGQAKLQAALTHARQLAAAHGLRLTDEQWQSLLESAVKDLKDAGREIRRATEQPPAA